VSGVAGATAAGATSNAAFLGGTGGGVLSGFAGIAAASALSDAGNLNGEADEFGDAAMAKQAGLLTKNSRTALGAGVLATGQDVANTVNIAQGGAAEATKGAAPAAAGVAGAVLGIVAGSALLVQGTWRAGKAAWLGGWARCRNRGRSLRRQQDDRQILECLRRDERVRS
jgi:hypothetical protein